MAIVRHIRPLFPSNLLLLGDRGRSASFPKLGSDPRFVEPSSHGIGSARTDAVERPRENDYSRPAHEIYDLDSSGIFGFDLLALTLGFHASDHVVVLSQLAAENRRSGRRYLRLVSHVWRMVSNGTIARDARAVQDKISKERKLKMNLGYCV